LILMGTHDFNWGHPTFDEGVARAAWRPVIYQVFILECVRRLHINFVVLLFSLFDIQFFNDNSELRAMSIKIRAQLLFWGTIRRVFPRWLKRQLHEFIIFLDEVTCAHPISVVYGLTVGR
jgi:hypothetical protein